MNSLLERLTSPLDIDAFASTVSPLWGTRLRGVVEAVIPQTESAATIRIRPGAGWQTQTPGQAVTIGVDVNGVRHHRTFTITSAPDASDKRIEITVESASGGLVSNHLVHRATPGEVLQLTKPHGGFTVPSTSREKLLFVTGGSGITPAVAIVRSILNAGSTADIVLLHHSKSPDRTLFGAELEDWSLSVDGVAVVLTHTSEGGNHLNHDRLNAECPDWAERQVYACGPAPLVGFVKDHWAIAGLAERVHTESFVSQLAPSVAVGGSPRPPTGSSTGIDDPGPVEDASTVKFGRAGLTTTAESGVPLLDIAESAGLQPAYGCRMGICHTCTTLLDEGCVTDLRDGRVSEAGSHVQICVSAPLGDVSVDL